MGDKIVKSKNLCCQPVVIPSLSLLKGHKSKFTIVNGETFRNNFIFLPAYSLVIWFMRSSKNFVKIAILKI